MDNVRHMEHADAYFISSYEKFELSSSKVEVSNCSEEKSRTSLSPSLANYVLQKCLLRNWISFECMMFVWKLGKYEFVTKVKVKIISAEVSKLIV